MRLFPIIKDDVRMRLDRWLKVNFQRPQSFFQRHLRQKRIFLFDASTQRRVKVEASFVLPDDANLRIGMTPALFHELTDGGVWNKLPSDTSKHDLPPELALPILFEDEFFVALHKPVHLATQLGTGMTDSVASRYLHYKLVHRLDKETSGVLLLAKTRLAAADMATLFRDNKVQKTYVALVHGTPALGRSGEIDEPIDGQPAQTSYKVLKPTHPRPDQGSWTTTWLELRPHTGRKHQLRRHCAHVLKAPIVGDHRYSVPSPRKTLHEMGTTLQTYRGRMMLHAHQLSFVHPVTKARVVVTCPDATFPDPKSPR
ncbi:hypothetical protein H310_05444 [Aphanomyces invadans]|uniref:Pseudouridine synthase RsuA/RluA-like domain-containing protein n=1 Tax=Aphanomyces invadans TaxID=157072 RepID=A0A024UBL3_9STRA|nr:hypothetical protein H310_05444 [Aphanomyces invadans]ETW03008.1 hypothetical protein H310_05444 [Aphanomyces invadans]|eukprot:XP_008868392.1 hypothetical protein H310_05444 [Aphanomyces invadans]